LELTLSMEIYCCEVPKGAEASTARFWVCAAQSCTSGIDRGADRSGRLRRETNVRKEDQSKAVPLHVGRSGSSTSSFSVFGGSGLNA
jgi:hypothetical protein